MKLTSLCFVLLVSLAARCQPAREVRSIQFTRESRGFLDQTTLRRDSLIVLVDNHRMTPASKHYRAPLDEKDWLKLLHLVSDLSLSEIDGLQSPTMNRAHDGALHGSIVITMASGERYQHGFDNEDPHPDLKPLLEAILSFRNQYPPD